MKEFDEPKHKIIQKICIDQSINTSHQFLVNTKKK